MYSLRIMVVATAAVVLAGCSGLEPAQRDQARGRTASAAHSAGPQSGQTYFVGSEGLIVRDQPAAPSAVIGHLRLHERVTRLRIHGAYALVTAPASGVKGWVENGQLIAHLPASGPGTQDASPHPSATTPDRAPPPPAAATTDPAPPPSAATPDSEPAAVKAPAAKATPVTSTPEMFDPF
jgi:hypothetical protein